jgi:UPF0176 protein
MEHKTTTYSICAETMSPPAGQEYWILAYYRFAPVSDPHQEVRAHKAFLASLDARCRVYISEEGINGQLSIHGKDAEAYMAWLSSRPPFEGIEFKIHYSTENIYPRQTIKYRKQLVAFDQEVDLSLYGEHLSPEKWREMLENDQQKVIIDTRNDYEWAIGHFEGSELPACGEFRAFPKYTQELKERVDPKTTPIMMCCTGGIRCEIYSAYLKQEGFEKVYQLEGGIIKYGIEERGKHWDGKLFVFDDRLAVPLHTQESADPIANCHYCQIPEDTYYNCANVECNELFVCCRNCANEHRGCCCQGCMEAERVRPYNDAEPYKPMRRWHTYAGSAEEAVV